MREGGCKDREDTYRNIDVKKTYKERFENRSRSNESKEEIRRKVFETETREREWKDGNKRKSAEM